LRGDAGVKRIIILGSTGSIGRNALWVAERFPDRFQVVGLGAGRNIDLLSEQVRRFRPRTVAVLTEELARDLRRRLEPGTEVLAGLDGYQELARLPEGELVLSAMVGAAGLMPTLAAIRSGKDVALANKETLVMAGALVTEEVWRQRGKLLPVDSEHSAIFQALAGHRREDLKRIVLTASGGPFLRATREELRDVTPALALAHPNWRMGPKVTIDSATLMNKGLEVVEARWLFDLDVSQISVVVHPQSIIHSLVEYVDGSVLAQMGIPDMRVPIAYALSHPERLPLDLRPLDLVAMQTLTFLDPDVARFPCLSLAFAACRAGGTMPAVLNAANEVAVEAFLAGRIPFLAIARVVEESLERHRPDLAPAGAEVILEADRWARAEAESVIGGLR
jgi:1-deoxy-D-xylulose-5-phosphate reductoisomerase